MATPSVVSMSTTRGSTVGGGLVRIYGDGFQLPSAPAATIPAPVQPPTVEVLFGTQPSPRVLVLASNQIAVTPPPSPVDPVLVRMAPGALLTFAPGGPPTITRDSGDWLADGFVPGSSVVVAGSASNDATADSPYLVADVSALVLTLDASVALVAEGPVSAAVESLSYGEAVVDVTIRNVDPSGTPIPGESVTLPLAYEFARVRLSDDSTLRLITRNLIRAVRRGVLPNVSSTTHTDWSQDDLTGALGLAKLPGIALLGPTIDENRFHSLNRGEESQQPDGSVLVHCAPFTVDLSFSVLLLSDLTGELLSLVQLWEQFVDRTPYLTLLRDESDPSAGSVRFELDVPFGGSVAVSQQPSDSNVRAATGSIVVTGVDFEALTGFADETSADVVSTVLDVEEPVTVGFVQQGTSYPIGPSPGGTRCP